MVVPWTQGLRPGLWMDGPPSPWANVIRPYKDVSGPRCARAYIVLGAVIPGLAPWALDGRPLDRRGAWDGEPPMPGANVIRPYTDRDRGRVRIRDRIRVGVGIRPGTGSGPLLDVVGRNKDGAGDLSRTQGWLGARAIEELRV